MKRPTLLALSPLLVFSPARAAGAQSGPSIPSVDRVMTDFMAKYSVPGLSLAITKDGRLVYSKAYGKADETQPLPTNHLFRIASLSKQITSIAIMRLLDQGKISLDQKVFGPGA